MRRKKLREDAAGYRRSTYALSPTSIDIVEKIRQRLTLPSREATINAILERIDSDILLRYEFLGPRTPDRANKEPYPTAGNRLKPAVSLSLTPPLRASAQHVGQDWRGCRYLTGGVCGRGRNPTLRIWASDIPRLD